jgi:RND family efflux transporter MFP subunit
MGVAFDAQHYVDSVYGKSRNLNGLEDQQSEEVTVAAALVGAILVFLVLWVAGWFEGSEQEADQPLRVATQAVQLESSLTTNRSFTGRVEARREAAVGFELGGLISRVRVEEGQRVRKGAQIANLDTAILRARRRELVSDRSRAEAERDLAQSTLERVKAAFERDAVSTQAVDEASRSLKTSTAALSQAAASIRSLDVQISKSTLRAPFNAIITSRLVDEGTVVNTGTAVAHLLEDAALEVRVGVSDAAADELNVGQSVNLQVAGEAVKGTVLAVLPLTDRESRSVDVIVELETSDSGVRHGDLARLTVPLERDETGIWLPMNSLTESSSGIWAVYVANPNKQGIAKLERRQLQVIHQEADRVFVRGTLKSGDRVVVSGLQRLSPGLIVDTSRPDNAKQSAAGESTNG